MNHVNQQKKRKPRNRVQGGWSSQGQGQARGTSKTSSRTGSDRTQPEGQGQYVYQDPAHRGGSMTGKRPPNFSWIVEDVLAGCAFPHMASHFQYLVSQGIRHLITLTEFEPPMHVAPPELRYTFMPVREFDAPSLQQVQDFVDIVEQARQVNEAVAVHCHWGRGRTGTMLAAYLIKHCRMLPQAAINEVRRQRPYSIETYAQEDVIYLYGDLLLNSDKSSSNNTDTGATPGSSSSAQTDSSNHFDASETL